MTREEILNAALQLPDADREALGEALLTHGAIDPDLADAWADDLQRRLDEMDEGRVQLIPADIALERARSHLREARMRRAS